MSPAKRLRARRAPSERVRSTTIPDDLAGVRSGRMPRIPAPPKMPSDSASLPRAPISFDFAELEGIATLRSSTEDGFTADDGIAPTIPCPPRAHPTERPTVPSPASKTSGTRRKA